jgi:hypothetical protein
MPGPPACVTRATDPAAARMTVTLDGCAGPFGLGRLSGDIAVAFLANDDGSLHADQQGRGLTADGAPVTFSASADITLSGATRNARLHAAWTHTNDRGEVVAHSADFTIVLDVTRRCRDVNGAAVTTIGGREVDTAVQDYRICERADGSDACPSGTLDHTRPADGAMSTALFDGTEVATVTAGRAVERVWLACDP